jgi:heptosyltransferase-2
VSRSSPPGTVLVLRFSSAGDIVLASPAIDALHKAWPGTRIVYAVKGPFADLVRQHPAVSEVIETREGESFLGYLARLKAAKPDVILDLHGKMRSRMIRWLLPRSIPKVVWNKRPWEDNVPVRLGLRPYKAAMLISDRYHAAVEKLVGGKVPYGEMRHYLGPDDQAIADAALTKAGLDPAKPTLGMSPGANWETKRWPADRFAALAKRAAEQGMQVVLTGSRSEYALAETVRAAVPNAANLCGALPLKALGGVISRCTAFVANDSGPMHMARALGVPTLTFFGSTDPDQFLFDGHHAMFAGVECSPCHFYGRRKCPKGHFRCMLDLSSDQAWGALTTLVARKGERVPFVRG